MQRALLFLFILSVQFTVAQTEEEQISIIKGTQNLELDFRYSGSVNEVGSYGDIIDQGKSKLFGISSSYGVAVAKNFVVGANLQFRYEEEINVNQGDDQIARIERFYGFGLYGKKYWNITNRLLLNGRAEASYSILQITDMYKKGSLFRVGLRPGLTYFLSKQIALEGTLGFIGYSSIRLEDPEGSYDSYSKIQSFDAQFDTSELSLGVSYYF
ncbi:hypothetical protein [Leeuwenhoekiella nanhaiensis]|uniref:Outer membrane protein beta-barrel domain-containing protein n=1 Tax=Leeuwenhoekiella nanhaiensis TaxID=1655491 RepID=A0A2G1VUJ3_9FLAO|nr:hypothetical protein [Leeuwenhoekiella nanhaiensis]PHQ30414.1 hypothetical protein CJ305_05500 [Leeuwenhoekiella nanhaiensis]